MQETPEPAQTVADRRWRDIQSIGSARDMAFLQNGAEQHQQAKVDAEEMSGIQHGGDFLSLASGPVCPHLCPITTQHEPRSIAGLEQQRATP